jgi:hypothetical protein
MLKHMPQFNYLLSADSSSSSDLASEAVDNFVDEMLLLAEKVSADSRSITLNPVLEVLDQRTAS